MENLLELIETAKPVWEFVMQAGALTAIIVAFVGGLKSAGIVKDGQAEYWFKAIQLVVFALLTVWKAAVPELNFGALEALAADLAETYGALTAIILPFLNRLGGYLYELGIKGTPIIGKSYSADETG